MTATYNIAFTGEKIKREQYESILRTALLMEETRFARQASLNWLAHFPGDLPINLLYAQSLLNTGLLDQAIGILEKICQTDPEYLAAVETLVQAHSLQQLRQPARDQKVGHSPNRGYMADRLDWLIALGGNPDVIRYAGLGHSILREKSTTSWSRVLSKSRYALQQGDIEGAERDIQEVLGVNPDCPLVAATHLKILLAHLSANGSGTQIIRSLAAFYQQRWPACLVCTFALAEALMDSGEPDLAVALLHEAASKDITGRVAKQLWGDNHAYRSIWQSHLEIDLDIPIPASVTSALGWNILPQRAGFVNPPLATTAAIDQMEEVETTKNEDTKAELDDSSPTSQKSQAPETLRSVQSELERISSRLNRPGLAYADGRFPIYVLMTTRQGIEKRFGQQTLTVIEGEMLRLVNAIQQRREWGALLYYADEASYIRSDNKHPMRLKRPNTRPDDPWGLKLALLDLDNALKKRGERIGAVLIIGGPDVVPFHHLPNPVDDADDDVPSDNPYGTSDDNYFIPEWPVGRLPDSSDFPSNNPQSLLYNLSGLTARHNRLARENTSLAWYRRWFGQLFNWMKRKTRLPNHTRPSFGYTAAVWRQASMSVFRPIGEPRALHISPPEGSSHPVTPAYKNSSPLPPARLGYFNLHGLMDAAEWYGQRDHGGDGLPGLVGDGDDYPIAVQPSDVSNSGRAPQVIFTEACYGAHIINKSLEEALALKFLHGGTQAVVGSTCISYGAIKPPLIAADFLGHAFWTYLREGLPAGEALRRAKISLAREMHNRQGYLDGEDQKTLISFVLYGDPMAVPEGLEFVTKSFQRPAKPPANIKTVCDLAHEDEANLPVPEEILEYVKSVVEQYLPGMAGSQLTLSHEHVNCEAAQPKHSPGLPRTQQEQTIDHLTGHQPYKLARKVITLSKNVPNSTHLHHHYARLTLDAQGKLVKLVVSR